MDQLGYQHSMQPPMIQRPSIGPQATQRPSTAGCERAALPGAQTSQLGQSRRGPIAEKCVHFRLE